MSFSRRLVNDRCSTASGSARVSPRAASNAPSRSASPARGRAERPYLAAGPRAPATTGAGCARSLGSVRQRSNAVTHRWGIPPGGKYPHVPSIDRLANPRSNAAHHLNGLDRDELDPYLSHRLRLAGCELPLFEPPAVEALFQSARGLPRLVNRIAHYALTAAALNHARTVTAEHLEHAVAELRL